MTRPASHPEAGSGGARYRLSTDYAGKIAFSLDGAAISSPRTDSGQFGLPSFERVRMTRKHSVPDSAADDDDDDDDVPDHQKLDAVDAHHDNDQEALESIRDGPSRNVTPTPRPMWNELDSPVTPVLELPSGVHIANQAPASTHATPGRDTFGGVKSRDSMMPDTE
jgi:hypothetical protein